MPEWLPEWATRRMGPSRLNETGFSFNTYTHDCMIHTINARGLLCPQPLILTRKALKASAEGDTLQIECDNRTAYENITTYLKDQSLMPQGSESQGIFTIQVENRVPGTAKIPEPASVDGSFCTSAYVVVAASDKMGEGDPDLGNILMKGFINALADQPVLPTHLVLYNSGVLLAREGSGVNASLKTLEESGVEILVCGTCIDFYDIREQLTAGTVSNMFTITETMARTGHVVKP